MEGRKLAILVGGGPAPGINSVISSVTIEAIKKGAAVVGIYDGFSHLEKRHKNVEFLTIPKVSRIHITGGSILRTSRANPTKSEEKLKNVVEMLTEMEVDYLVTIGGDDTAFSARKVAEFAGRMGYELKCVHVPKTIDNDLPLPAGIDTFGYETARSEGSRIISTLMEDARTSGRWFIVTAMGRKAGHLALGIGKAAGATLTLIPEEFFSSGNLSIECVIDSIAGAVVKRKAAGYGYGVAVIAEGFFEFFKEEDVLNYIGKEIERDEHGHIRLAEINISDVIKSGVKRKLAKFGITPTIVDQKLGYELRCVAPCPSDIEYTRNLGYAAVDYLAQGGSGAMITIQHDRITPMNFDELVDPETGKTRVRLVDINSIAFTIAQEYMIRLKKSDFADDEKLLKLAKAANTTPEEFRREFEDCVR